MRTQTTVPYIRGCIYSPDDLNNLPQETVKYFSQEGLEEWGHVDYEYGTCKCIKSFEIITIIKEL